ncbi:MAG: phosphatase PAP2 family protein [Myxococcales bacterium]|nr:phosphatase PAP2 family protein [Myxococcales bacterium]
MHWLDGVVVAYLTFYCVRVGMAPPSGERTFALVVFGLALAICVTGILLVRGELLRTAWRGMVYRSTVLVAILGVFLVGLRHALVAIQPVMRDAELAALDRSLFGVVPAQWLERFAHPVLTEWLAFFYFSYFFMLILAVIPPVFRGGDRVTSERVIGIVLIDTIGQATYALVPGRGPYAALPFDAPLTGGPVWRLVLDMVAGAGPMLDIFPSLHTALSTFIALHLWRTRHERPPSRRVLAGLAVFSATQIVIATLYLRWHYAIDVIAGLALMTVALVLIPRVGAADARRIAAGRQPALASAERWKRA